jgi:malate permease and related proteins
MDGKPMPISATIIPIFIIVILGWFVHSKGFLPSEFQGPANRLVFYVAIPAIIFQSIARSALGELFNPRVVVITLTALTASYAVSWFVCYLARVPRHLAGTFIQASGHGNLGYFGFAVAFYYLGDAGLAQASIVAGFVMILQNIFSIMALQRYASQSAVPNTARNIVFKVVGNPVILAVLAGMLVALLEIPLPLIVERSLTILSGLALPTALLVIGASLSIGRMQAHRMLIIGASAIKLLFMPGLGWLLFLFCGIPVGDYLPALILLASPTATIAFVMARELQGDSDLAVAVISASTLLSALTYMLWLSVGRI